MNDSEDNPYSTLDGTKSETVIKSLKIEAQEAKISPTFICEFTETVSPKHILETIFNIDNCGYDATAFPLKVSSDDEYYQINGILGFEDGVGAKLDAEICPDWMRVYIRSDTNTEALTDFFNSFYDEYPFEIVVASQYLKQST